MIKKAIFSGGQTKKFCNSVFVKLITKDWTLFYRVCISFSFKMKPVKKN